MDPSSGDITVGLVAAEINKFYQDIRVDFFDWLSHQTSKRLGDILFLDVKKTKAGCTMFFSYARVYANEVIVHLELKNPRFMSELIVFYPAQMISVKRFTNDELQQILNDDVKGLLHLNSTSNERSSHYRGSKKPCITMAPIREIIEDWDRDIAANPTPSTVAFPTIQSSASLLKCGTILFNNEMAFLDEDDIYSEDETDVMIDQIVSQPNLSVLANERVDVSRKLDLVSNVLERFKPGSNFSKPFKNSQMSLIKRLQELDLQMELVNRPLKRAVSSASMP